MDYDRSLRLLSLVVTAIAVPLSIATTIVSVVYEQRQHGRYWARRPRPLTTFCFFFIPLAMSIFTSSLHLRYLKRGGKSPTGLHTKVLDSVSVLAYLGILIPIWAIEVRRLEKPGLGLLVGYTTAPYIVNLTFHTYFALEHLPWKRAIPSFLSNRSTCQQCPSCQTIFINGSTQKESGSGYSLLRGDDYLDADADAVAYRDSRDSEDFLGQDAEQAEQVEQHGGKGKAMVEV